MEYHALLTGECDHVSTYTITNQEESVRVKKCVTCGEILDRYSNPHNQ